MPLTRTRRSRRPQPFDHGEPIWRPSLAPLAAVWAIAAVLALSTYGTPIHAVMIDLPVASPPDLTPPPDMTMPVHRISVGEQGTPILNGRTVSLHVLSARLHTWAEADWKPGIVFEPMPEARYADALPVLGAIAEAGLAGWQFCFGGLAEYRDFGASPANIRLNLTFVDLDLHPYEPIPRPEIPECDPRRAWPADLVHGPR